MLSAMLYIAVLLSLKFQREENVSQWCQIVMASPIVAIVAKSIVFPVFELCTGLSGEIQWNPSLRTPLKWGHLSSGHCVCSQLHRSVYKITPEVRTPPINSTLCVVANASTIEGSHCTYFSWQAIAELGKIGCLQHLPWLRTSTVTEVSESAASNQAF